MMNQPHCALLSFRITCYPTVGPLDEEIFMLQPEGFGEETERVCQLRKGFYGLKQAPSFCNSDFAGDLDTKRSTTEFVFTLNGGPVAWSSTTQSTTVLAATKAKL